MKLYYFKRASKQAVDPIESVWKHSFENGNRVKSKNRIEWSSDRIVVWVRERERGWEKDTCALCLTLFTLFALIAINGRIVNAHNSQTIQQADSLENWNEPNRMFVHSRYKITVLRLRSFIVRNLFLFHFISS